MPDVNQMAAGGLADRMMGPPPPGGGAVDPQAVEAVRMHLAEALKVITSSPQVMMAVAQDIQGFVMTIKQFAEAGGGGGQPPQEGPPMGGMPPQGGPPMGAGMGPQGPMG